MAPVNFGGNMLWYLPHEAHGFGVDYLQALYRHIAKGKVYLKVFVYELYLLYSKFGFICPFSP